DPRELRVVHADAVELAALAAELEFHAGAIHLHVAVAHGRQAEGIVLLGVTLVAYADAGPLEQLHEEREHLAARQPGDGHVGAHLAADARQGPRECGEALELVGVAQLAPARVLAILLAAARVPARGLQVAALVGADPHVGPRRGDGEAPDPLERRLVVDAFALCIHIPEAGPLALAREPFLVVARIAQPPHRHGARRSLALRGGGVGHRVNISRTRKKLRQEKGRESSPPSPLPCRASAVAVAARSAGRAAVAAALLPAAVVVLLVLLAAGASALPALPAALLAAAVLLPRLAVTI